jgi:hypothetical protein
LPQWQGSSALNLWEINRIRTHTALVPMLTYYGSL